MAKDTGKFDYEERNLPIKGLFLFTVGMFLCIFAVAAFVKYVYGIPKSHPVPELVLNRPMNQPVLQSRPQDEQKAFRAKQEEILSSVGWVNKAQGVVHIPIRKAMDLVIRRGLPAREGGQ